VEDMSAVLERMNEQGGEPDSENGAV